MAQQRISTRVYFDKHPLRRKVKIYDVEKKELLFICDSMYAAEKITGVKSASAYLSKKTKCYTNKLGKVICFR